MLRILEEEYGDGAGGLSGNDDAGQMSAWYVFAAMGFYPVNPVSGEYQLSTPLFDEIHIKVGPQKILHIITSKSSKTAKYIAGMRFNGKPHANTHIKYAEIMRGGTFEFMLTDEPKNVSKQK